MRPQPRYGTVEVRDHGRADDGWTHTAALTALVQGPGRGGRCVEGPAARTARPRAGEVLAENRFLAARDGVAAEFVDPVRGDRRLVRQPK